MPGERDCSIWVGDLTPEVDDLELYKFFAARFNTVRTAKGNLMLNIIFIIDQLLTLLLTLKTMKLHNLLNFALKTARGCLLSTVNFLLSD